MAVSGLGPLRLVSSAVASANVRKVLMVEYLPSKTRERPAGAPTFERKQRTKEDLREIRRFTTSSFQLHVESLKRRGIKAAMLKACHSGSHDLLWDCALTDLAQ
jgi:hypothetical protein